MDDPIPALNTGRVIVAAESFDRAAVGIPCPACNGYADRGTCTADEVADYNCGRPYVCCARAFVCRVCRARIVGRADAPDYD